MTCNFDRHPRAWSGEPAASLSETDPRSPIPDPRSPIPDAPRSVCSAAVRWIVRGDIDGFFGLAIDNLVQLLLIDTLCRGVLGFPPDLVYGRILPGAAISVLVGNIAYAMQAKQLAQRSGRTDVCALPYGINTVSLFAHVFLVMLPAKTMAIAAGASKIHSGWSTSSSSRRSNRSAR